MSTHTVHITKLAEKQLLKAPKHIVRKLRDWMLSVEFVVMLGQGRRSRSRALTPKAEGRRFGCPRLSCECWLFVFPTI